MKQPVAMRAVYMLLGVGLGVAAATVKSWLPPLLRAVRVNADLINPLSAITVAVLTVALLALAWLAWKKTPQPQPMQDPRKTEDGQSTTPGGNNVQAGRDVNVAGRDVQTGGVGQVGNGPAG